MTSLSLGNTKIIFVALKLEQYFHDSNLTTNLFKMIKKHIICGLVILHSDTVNLLSMPKIWGNDLKWHQILGYINIQKGLNTVFKMYMRIIRIIYTHNNRLFKI